MATPVQSPAFKSYGDYLVATQKDVRPGSSYNATVTTPTGFLEFKPRDMETQKKYDAMSPAWEGVESSMKAVEKGVYALDSAEATRQELRQRVKIPDGRGPTPVKEAQRQALYPPIGICAQQ